MSVNFTELLGGYKLILDRLAQEDPMQDEELASMCITYLANAGWPVPEGEDDLQEDHCPKCNAELLYGEGEVQDDQYVYTVECPSCGWAGGEWYKLVFDGLLASDDSKEDQPKADCQGGKPCTGCEACGGEPGDLL